MEFKFLTEYDQINSKKISLNIVGKYIGNDKELPYYWYDIIENKTNNQIGKISIRIGHNDHSYYNGNIGYEINKGNRGHHYSYDATLLVLQVAKAHKMKHIIITCDEDNFASNKIVIKLGAKLIETAEIPKDYFAYYEGIPKHNIYKLNL